MHHFHQLTVLLHPHMFQSVQIENDLHPRVGKAFLSTHNRILKATYLQPQIKSDSQLQDFSALHPV